MNELNSQISAEQLALESLREHLQSFDKDTFAALVYEQLKQGVGIAGEFPSMIPIIVDAMEKAFNQKKKTRHGWPSSFIKTAMLAYFTSRADDEVQSNPKNLEQLMAFATSGHYAIPGYPDVRIVGKGNSRKVHYRDDEIGTWSALDKAFDRANKLHFEIGNVKTRN